MTIVKTFNSPTPGTSSPDGGVGLPASSPTSPDGGVGLPNVPGAPVAGAPEPNLQTGAGIFDPFAPPHPNQAPSNARAPYVETHDYDHHHSAVMEFYHPAIGYLTTEYGVNEVSWNYSLNVQKYSTYAGEVIQILSTYVDDITMTGQVATYAQMELLYIYFARYMEIATQGPGPKTLLPIINAPADQGSATDTTYNEQPMRVKYVERGWEFYIQPREMIGFKYGREVVVPEWRLTAAVYDANPTTQGDINQAIISMQNNSFVRPTDQNPGASQLDNSFDIVGEIGFNPNNPFSNPFPEAGITGTFDASAVHPLFTDFGKYYNDIVKNYSTNKYNDTLDLFGSAPTTANPNSSGTTKTKAK